MMKDQATVIREFNELVNMTASELEKWLKSDDSQSAGWPKDGENGDGETVGHESGRKIIAILESNPEKDPEKYSEEDIDHMRKVVAYCKRHLAQEEKALSKRTDEEAKKTKSYASLKNWGHDMLKKEAGDDGEADEGDKKAANGDAEKHTGDKRKATEDEGGPKKRRDKKSSDDGDDENDQQSGDGGEANGPKGGKEGKKETKDEEEEEDSKKDTKAEKEERDSKKDTQAEKNKGDSNKKGQSDDGTEEDADKATNGPEVGDTVSWNWGNGQPEGKVLDVRPEKTTITTKRGNEASRKGSAEDPAVVIDTGKSKAVKSAHELN